MAPKMNKKNTEAIAEFENNIISLFNYKQIENVFDYLKKTDFTPKQVEGIIDIIESKFYPISAIHNKPAFDTAQTFASSVPYFLNMKYSKDKKEDYDIERFSDQLLKATKENHLSYLSYALISNIENKFIKNFSDEIIKEITILEPDCQSVIKSHLKNTIGALNSVNSSNIQQIEWLLDNNFIDINTFYNDKTLSFLASDVETLRFLKRKDADFLLLNTKNDICAFYNKNIECLDFLISEGVNPNHLNIYGKNLAFYMIKDHSVKINEIAKLGLNIHQVDEQNCNLLNYTTSIDQATYLLNNNININKNIFYSEEIRDLVKAHQEKIILQNGTDHFKKHKPTF